MKLGPVTELDKRNKTRSKKMDVDVMSENCNAIVIFRIFRQFGAVRRPDSGYRVCSHTIVLSKVTFFRQKMLIFCKKVLTSAKLRDPRH